MINPMFYMLFFDEAALKFQRIYGLIRCFTTQMFSNFRMAVFPSIMSPIELKMSQIKYFNLFFNCAVGVNSYQSRCLLYTKSYAKEVENVSTTSGKILQ